MHRVLQSRRLVECTAFDADRRAALAGMPQPRAAGRTERAVEHPPGIPGAGPARRRALRQPQRLAREDDRDAERRSRLLAALATVADVNDARRLGDGEADLAALAATGRC